VDLSGTLKLMRERRLCFIVLILSTGVSNQVASVETVAVFGGCSVPKYKNCHSHFYKIQFETTKNQKIICGDHGKCLW